MAMMLLTFSRSTLLGDYDDDSLSVYVCGFVSLVGMCLCVFSTVLCKDAFMIWFYSYGLCCLRCLQLNYG